MNMELRKKEGGMILKMEESENGRFSIKIVEADDGIGSLRGSI